MSMAVKENADFHTFKPDSGKWKYSGRGYLSADVFKFHDSGSRRRQILKDNDGKIPGMSSAGSDLVLVVIGDHEVEHGYPLMLKPEE
jgi:hypothetical protein